MPHAGAAPHDDTAPQALADPQLEPHELAPHGLQLDAQGAEQHELTLLPQQLPACAEAVIRTAAASDKNKRIPLNSSSKPKILTQDSAADTPQPLTSCSQPWCKG